MIEYTNGTKWYNYNNGRLHREDGPAIELINGSKSWYLNGIKYSEGEHNAIIRFKSFI